MSKVSNTGVVVEVFCLFAAKRRRKRRVRRGEKKKYNPHIPPLDSLTYYSIL
jgi:hypothetical protein